MFQVARTLTDPTVFFSLAAVWVAILLLRGQNRRRWQIAMVVLVAMWALSAMPIVGDVLLGRLENISPPLEPAQARSDTIVVLSAGVRSYQGPQEPLHLDAATSQRCVYGLWFFRQTHARRIVVSGGVVKPGSAPAASLMRDYLVSLGVPASGILVEDESLSTMENAAFCRKILAPQQIEKVVLVTDASHMFRAARCFRAYGIEVQEAPCNFQAAPFRWSLGMFLPNSASAGCTRRLAYEVAGLASSWLRRPSR